MAIARDTTEVRGALADKKTTKARRATKARMAMEEDDTPNIEKGDKAVNNTIRSEDTELQNTRTKSKAMDSSKITTEDIYLEHHKNHT